MTEPGLDGRRQWVLSALEEYEGRLIRYAGRLLGDEASARDVVQHAFLRLCGQTRGSIDGRVGPWLYSVCRHRAVDLIRARQRTESLEQENRPPVAGAEPDPADVAQTRDLHRRLLGRMARLPEAQREALDLWVEGFSYQEIAQIASTSQGNVRVLVHRAIRALREDPATRKLVEG